MSTEKLKAEQLAALSVEQLLDLDCNAIAPMEGFQNYPKGSYSGLLVAFSVPDPSKDINYFESTVIPTAVIELADAQELELAHALIEKGAAVRNRYYITTGMGVASMNTEWLQVIAASGGKVGNLMYRVTQEQIPVNFVLSHRASKPGKNATAAEKAAFTPQTFVEVRQVTPA